MIEFTSISFDDAIKFFRDKTPLTPDKFRQLTDEAKTKAFTVSGITRDDIVRDIYAAMDKAISEKTTFADFKKSVTDAEALGGWKGETPYRLDTVFRTNVQQAFQAGHERQMMQSVKSRPYWQYMAVMDGRTRSAHAALNGKVAAHDDPFWQKNFPPNGFNCRCTVVSLSKSELDRDGLDVSSGLPDIADPGFMSNPGDSLGKMLTKEQFEKLQDDPGRWTDLIEKTFENYSRKVSQEIVNYAPAEAALWPKGEKAVQLYKDEMMGQTFTDVVGDPLIMGEEFISHLKLDGRERFLPLIGQVVADPYEIWLQAAKEKQTGKIVLRKKYISYIKAGEDRPLLLVAESSKGQWLGYTYLYSSDAKYLDSVRNGVLIYGKEE